MNTKTQIEIPKSAVPIVTKYLDEHGIQYETQLITLKTKTISITDLPIHALNYIRGVLTVTEDK